MAAGRRGSGDGAAAAPPRSRAARYPPRCHRALAKASPVPTAPETQPHRDPTEWGRLVESLDVASIFVVLGAWLGPKLRAELAVEDIWQETLWQSWRDREQHAWTNLAAWRAWLLTIAKNRIRDAARTAGRVKRGGDRSTSPMSALAGVDSVSALLPPGSTTPSRVAGVHERARAMSEALATLDDDLQAVVRLRLFEEVPMRDVAAQLGLPLSTAKARLLRGVEAYRRRLRQLLGGDAGLGTSQ
jgi:RNA polymerase sigma-70 factor (ECF subfamily)